MGGTSKRYYPAFVDLNGRTAVVVGSGPVAERKARQLVRYGADVTVIGRDPGEGLLQAESEGHLIVEDRDYVRGDLAGATVVVCTLGDPETQRAVFEEAHAEGALVTVTDNPRLSSYVVPSVLHREPLQIAVSTGGMAPQLAKRLRRRLSGEFGPVWGAYAALVAQVRALGMDRLESREALDAMLEALLDSDTLERLERGEELTAEALYEAFAPAADGSGPGVAHTADEAEADHDE